METGTKDKERRLDRIIVGRDEKRVLVKHPMETRWNPRRRHSSTFKTSLFNLTAAMSSTLREDLSDIAQAKMLIKSTDLAPEWVRQVRRVLSVPASDRPVFLSRSYSVCSWEVSSSSVKKLISLPVDWINKDCLELCSAWDKEESFDCSRNGEVVVVKCSGLA